MPYGTVKTGPGRTVILRDAQGVQFGYLWCSDAGGLGFVPSSAPGVAKVSDLQGSFTAGSKAGKTARAVFDTWAARKDTVVAGDVVVVPDLSLLPS